jgi:uncharacterized protein (DUF58 family)
MSAAASTIESPTAVSLKELIAQKGVGETIRLSAPRIRAFAAGGHLSPFKGRGIEFDESRPYQEGDDLRTIDWRVTARTGKPHTKVFREERNRPVILWVDLSPSMMFATQGAFKSVIAARAAAIVAWSAIANGDQLGGLVFGGADHDELRPRLGHRAALRLLQLIATNAAWQSGGGEADPAMVLNALVRLTRVARPGSVAFLFSDFITLDTPIERQIRQLSSHCDVNLMHIFDPVEAELPPPGRYRIDMGKRVFTIDTSDERLRERYRAEFEQRRDVLRNLARMQGVRLVALPSHQNPVNVLVRSFARR